MATRRCISSKVVESNAFYKLSLGAQALYAHLVMAADDLGFCNNYDGVTCRILKGEAALQELISKRFVLNFGEVVVIKHWKMANTLKNDRMKPLNYPDVAAKIWMNPNKSYTDHPVAGSKTLFETYTGEAPRIPTGFQADSNWIPTGTLTEPNRIEPNRIEPNRSGEWAADSERKEWFDRILCAYPVHRQGNTAEGWQAFESSVGKGEEQSVFDGLAKWKRSAQWSEESGRWVPNFSKWLTQRLWKWPPEAEKPSGMDTDPDQIAAIRRMLLEDDGKGDG